MQPVNNEVQRGRVQCYIMPPTFQTSLTSMLCIWRRWQVGCLRGMGERTSGMIETGCMRTLLCSGCFVGVVSAPLACLSLSFSTVPCPLSAGESQI